MFEGVLSIFYFKQRLIKFTCLIIDFFLRQPFVSKNSVGKIETYHIRFINTMTIEISAPSMFLIFITLPLCYPVQKINAMSIKLSLLHFVGVF